MLIFEAEYCLLLNNYKRFGNNCRGCCNRNKSFCKVYYNIKHIDVFVNRAETCIFVKNKSFVGKINYKNNLKDNCIKENVEDC